MATKPENHDKFYDLLLAVEKQISGISRETGEQTQKLDSLNDKVAIANGRTGKNEGQINALIQWKNYILGGVAIVFIIGIYAATAFIREVTKNTTLEILKKQTTIIIKNNESTTPQQ